MVSTLQECQWQDVTCRFLGSSPALCILMKVSMITPEPSWWSHGDSSWTTITRSLELHSVIINSSPSKRSYLHTRRWFNYNCRWFIDPFNRNDPEECCNRPPNQKHPYCNELRIPDDDYFYRLFNIKCIDFVRGFPSPRVGCRLGMFVNCYLNGNCAYKSVNGFMSLCWWVIL